MFRHRLGRLLSVLKRMCGQAHYEYTAAIFDAEAVVTNLLLL